MNGGIIVIFIMVFSQLSIYFKDAVILF